MFGGRKGSENEAVTLLKHHSGFEHSIVTDLWPLAQELIT